MKPYFYGYLFQWVSTGDEAVQLMEINRIIKRIISQYSSDLSRIKRHQPQVSQRPINISVGITFRVLSVYKYASDKNVSSRA